MMADETKNQAPDDREPTPERQAELCAVYKANVAAGRAPYAGVRIRTRGELRWVMHERNWTGERDPGGKARAAEPGVVLQQGQTSQAPGTHIV